jgi:hypothetical protein
MVLTSDTLQAMKQNALWKLPQLLKAEGVSAYRLHKRLDELLGTSPTTVYRWARELPDNLDVATLMGVIKVLREETGKPVSVCDLLEYKTEVK